MVETYEDWIGILWSGKLERDISYHKVKSLHLRQHPIKLSLLEQQTLSISNGSAGLK